MYSNLVILIILCIVAYGAAMNFDNYETSVKWKEEKLYCQNKDYSIDRRTNSCYKYHIEPKNFRQAKSICKAEGGHLVIINSDEEAQVIREIFARHPEESIPGDFWKGHAAIGFYYSHMDSQWITLNGQTIQEAGYAKFDAGEPNNVGKDEYCGSVRRNGLLNDAPCSYRYSFICEKDPVSAPV